MELRVNNDYRVVEDGVYFTVQKRRLIGKSEKNPELNGTEVWENQTYHVTLPDANKSMLHKGIAMCNEFKSVIALLEDVLKQIENVKG